jgi:hypothetical protein
MTSKRAVASVGAGFPCSNTGMKKRAKTLLVVLWLSSALLVAQPPAPDKAAAKPADDYSGMYSFLRDGEFVQISIDDTGAVTGFVSRYGEQESDRGTFLNQFFKDAKLDGAKLSFTTETVHGTWYEFKGTVERGEGKNPGDEAYYVLKGTLQQFNSDADKKVSSKAREVVWKAFPKDLGAEPTPQPTKP